MFNTYLTAEAARRFRQGMSWGMREEILRTEGTLQPGEPVALRDEDGGLLGLGDLDLQSSPALRRLGIADETPEGIIPRQVRKALERRGSFVDNPLFCRIVNDDGDGLPGLIVDRYDLHCVVRTLSRPMDTRTDEIARALAETLPIRSVLLRNDSPARTAAGLPLMRPHVLMGAPPRWTRITELGARMSVDMAQGEGTGYFYEHRPIRRLIRRMAQNARVLDVRCGVGGFFVHAGLAGAKSILAFGDNPDSVELAKENAEVNGLLSRCKVLRADARTALSSVKEKFDLVLLDSRELIHPGDKAFDDFVTLAQKAIARTRRGGRMVVTAYHPPLPSGQLDAVIARACEREHRMAIRLARPALPADFPTVLGSRVAEALSALALEID